MLRHLFPIGNDSAMKICVVDSFPNHRFTAEKEFIGRMQIVGARLGFEVVNVETSDQILAEAPNLVLSTHEFTAKLTQVPTLGMMWSPTEFFCRDPQRVRNVLSYDGYLVGSQHVRNYLNDLTAEYPEQRKPIADFLVLPTCQSLDLVHERGRRRSLFYAGVHWDGYRYGCLFHHLDQKGILNVYGPQMSWDYVKGSYRGSIPFDGQSLLGTMANHGISLCLHRHEHICADTPSMRLFEAAAANNLIITDSIPFARRVFGDSVFVMDSDWTEYEKSEFIRETLIWAQENPDQADRLAEQAHEIFEREWSLDVMLPRIAAFGEAIDCRALAPPLSHLQSLQLPTLEVIIRCGSRPLHILERAVESVLHQRHLFARVLLVDFSDSPDLRAYADSHGDAVRYVTSQRTGYRSSALWDGLRAVKAPYFALLDDDDTVESDHWHRLICAIEHDQSKHQRAFAYSGVVRIEEDGAFVDNPGFNGDADRVVEETRELKFLDLFDPDRLLIYDNYIQSNAWVAKSSLLQSIDLLELEDPCLEVAEDVFLYLQFLAVTNFIPVFTQTANWHWRSVAGENSMLAVDQVLWRNAMDRALLRLGQKPFRGTTFQSAYLGAWLKAQNPPVPESCVTRPYLSFGSQSFCPSLGFVYQCESEGFHDGESSGAWSYEELAWIKGYLSEPSAAVYLELDLMVTPHPDGRDQRLTVKVNGVKVHSSIAPGWQKLRLAGVCSLPESTQAFTLMFMVERCYNPLQVNQGSDRRDLGVLLARVLLQPASNQRRIAPLLWVIHWRGSTLRPGFYRWVGLVRQALKRLGIGFVR